MANAYRCLVLDPPWAEYGGGGRGAQNHYALMRYPDIARAVLSSPSWDPAPNAHLWVWVTDNYLRSGVDLIDRCGFVYKRTFCWVKTNDTGAASLDRDDVELQIGLGQYARGAHELCLFATRGVPMVPEPANRPPSVLFAPRREHSRKPDVCFAEWFERVSPGPRLEMFARTDRPGWDAWGLEVGKFAQVVG